MIIAITNIKGGVGKSSIAQNLAVFIAQRKVKKSVLLVDADPQNTTSEWVAERNENPDLIQIPCVEQSGKISKALQEHDKNYDYVVVDCGGNDGVSMRSALAVADLAVIPCRPKRRDLKGVVSMATVVGEASLLNTRLHISSIVTQAPTLPSQAGRILAAKTLLNSLDLWPQRHITCNRNAWDDSEESGSSVLECEDDKARLEALAVFNELFEELDRLGLKV